MHQVSPLLAARPAPLRRARLRRALVAGAAAVLLAGCATDNTPKDYNADVESNYMSRCEETNSEELNAEDALAFCQCTYDAIRGAYDFEAFRELDRKLSDAFGSDDPPQTTEDLRAIDARYVNLIDGCTTVGPAAPGVRNTTTTTRPA